MKSAATSPEGVSQDHIPLQMRPPTSLKIQSLMRIEKLIRHIQTDIAEECLVAVFEALEEG